MSPSEELALNDAKAILRLHFDAFVVTTRTSDEDGTDRINSDWHGPLSDIIGIHRITSLRLDNIAVQRSLPPEIT